MQIHRLLPPGKIGKSKSSDYDRSSKAKRFNENEKHSNNIKKEREHANIIGLTIIGLTDWVGSGLKTRNHKN